MVWSKPEDSDTTQEIQIPEQDRFMNSVWSPQPHNLEQWQVNLWIYGIRKRLRDRLRARVKA